MVPRVLFTCLKQLIHSPTLHHRTISVVAPPRLPSSTTSNPHRPPAQIQVGPCPTRPHRVDHGVSHSPHPTPVVILSAVEESRRVPPTPTARTFLPKPTAVLAPTAPTNNRPPTHHKQPSSRPKRRTVLSSVAQWRACPERSRRGPPNFAFAFAVARPSSANLLHLLLSVLCAPSCFCRCPFLSRGSPTKYIATTSFQYPYTTNKFDIHPPPNLLE